jgi:hypothetical protein
MKSLEVSVVNSKMKFDFEIPSKICCVAASEFYDLFNYGFDKVNVFCASIISQAILFLNLNIICF